MVNSKNCNSGLQKKREIIALMVWLFGGIVLVATLSGLTLMTVLFAQIIGWGGALLISLFFAELLLMFTYSHPLGAYMEKAELLPLLGELPLKNIGGIIKQSIYAITVLMGIVLLGLTCPDIIKFCVPANRLDLVPFYVIELFLLYFIYAVLTKRAVSLFSASHTLRYEKIRADILFCSSRGDDPASREAFQVQKEALEEELEKIKIQVEKVKQSNYWFICIFILVSFAAFFLHVYLLSSFYFTLPSCWGLTCFIVLSLIYISLSLVLDNKFSCSDSSEKKFPD
ncbi:MAG: hypothetical protein ACI376_07220 [Candidatus Bruticola sp.]